MLKIGNFTVEHRLDRLYITSGRGQLPFSPGEADKIVSLAGNAVSLLTMPVLPPMIANSPFELYFKDDGKCAMKRTDGDGQLEFVQSDYDDLARAVELIVRNYTDSKRIKNVRKGKPGGFNYPDPVF